MHSNMRSNTMVMSMLGLVATGYAADPNTESSRCLQWRRRIKTGLRMDHADQRNRIRRDFVDSGRAVLPNRRALDGRHVGPFPRRLSQLLYCIFFVAFSGVSNAHKIYN